MPRVDADGGSTGLRPEHRVGEGGPGKCSQLVTELRTEGSELAKQAPGGGEHGLGAAPEGPRMTCLGGRRPADNSPDGGA